MSKSTYKTSRSFFELGDSDSFNVYYKSDRLILDRNQEFTSYNVADATTIICDFAFLKAKTLERVTLPQNLKAIGKSAFQGCRSLKEIHIPDGVEEIKEFAFAECTSLTCATIPGSVKVFQKYVFSGCTNLASISIAEGVEEIGWNAFKVTVLGNVKTLGTGIFFGCKNLRISNITFPKDHHWSIKNIGILN